jgi:hypothetical protein
MNNVFPPRDSKIFDISKVNLDDQGRVRLEEDEKGLQEYGNCIND